MSLGQVPGSSRLDDDEGEDGIFSEINITPLTDVFLVLLIIFMVTSTVITQNGVKVNLPKAGAASNTKQAKGITITIDSGNKLFLDKDPISYDNLEVALRQKLANTTEHSVILAGDRAVMLGEAMRVMDIAKKAGAERFAIATQSDGAKK